MVEAIRRHLLGYALGAAIGLAVLRFFMPWAVDFLIDMATLGLVWAAVRIGQRADPVEVGDADWRPDTGSRARW